MACMLRPNILSKLSSVAKRNVNFNSTLSMHKMQCRYWKNITFQQGCDHFLKIFNEKVIMKERICKIHVSCPRKAVPPLLVLALRSVAKIGAIVSGRLIRKWWKNLSPEEKKQVLEGIHSRKSKIAFIGTVISGGFYLYYLENMTEDPITKRKRFIMLNQKQLNQIAEFEYMQQLNAFKSHIIPSWHPIYRRVSRVANNILLANKDLEEIREKVWTVTVVDRPDITNAFALPHGKIFVFTGMLNLCTNDDQLAIVLAHEISHSILSHVAESMSKVFLIEFILLIPSIIIWSIFSDALALFSDWLVASIAKVLIHLPFSRAIEKEADFVGLHLAARACYDVREGPVFWAKMKILSADSMVEWLSTHPRHETRQIELRELVPEALKIRESNQCPPLPASGTFFF